LHVASGFAAEMGPWDRVGAGFLAGFAMRSSIRFAATPHHRNPTTAMTPAG
jgi:hypothetical protein